MDQVRELVDNKVSLTWNDIIALFYLPIHLCAINISINKRLLIEGTRCERWHWREVAPALCQWLRSAGGHQVSLLQGGREISGPEAKPQLSWFQGANLNAEDKHGITPLLAAVWEGHTSCVKFLLEKVSKKNRYDNPDINSLLTGSSQRWEDSGWFLLCGRCWKSWNQRPA